MTHAHKPCICEPDGMLPSGDHWTRCPQYKHPTWHELAPYVRQRLFADRLRRWWS